MHEIIDIIVNFANQIWYTWIFIMMVIESSFIPFPSEVAMIPAWYLASIWKIDFALALLLWTMWALVWATINYIIWFYYWEKFILKFINKFWKYFFINEEHYKKSELFFEKHWMITIFTGRFIPAVRQLISLPAWVFKINYAKFFFYTWLWAWLWNLALMIVWYIAWENQELIKQYLNELLFWAIIFIIIIWTIYYLIKNNGKK